MKKGTVLPLILILASVALIIGAFFILDNQLKKTTQNSTQATSPLQRPASSDQEDGYTPHKLNCAEETDGWKTCQGVLIKVSFKIPNDWAVEEKIIGGQPHEPPLRKDGKTMAWIYAGPPSRGQSFSVTTNYFERAEILQISSMERNVKVDGYSAKKRYQRIYCSDEDTYYYCDEKMRIEFENYIPADWYVYLDDINDNSYLLSGNLRVVDGADYKILDSTADKILSTFKFTN